MVEEIPPTEAWSLKSVARPVPRSLSETDSDFRWGEHGGISKKSLGSLLTGRGRLAGWGREQTVSEL